MYLAFRNCLADGVSLARGEARYGLVYAYLVGLSGIVIAANLLFWPYDIAHPDAVGIVLFLAVTSVILNQASAGIERGRLTLAALGVGAAAVLTNPLDATLIGVAAQVVQPWRGAWRIAWNVVFSGASACAGAILAALLPHSGSLDLWPRLLVLATLSLANCLIVLVALRLRTGDSIASVARQTVTPAFLAAFAYFALASLLISYVLDGSLLGYFLAATVCVLALALTDTIAGRRVRRVLESELSDADRHLFHSRAVEGVVHNLRNHMANALGYLREIDSRRLDPVDRESLETATDAANDAVVVLRGLAQGATPRVTYSQDPVDLNELASRALGMARPRARAKEAHLSIRESPDRVTVRADPLLMREVITNLVNNAVDAAPQGGKVEISVGRRSNGWPFLTVSDNGDGVSDDNRHRLFEPHFTTKEAGTGLGLFMSYGIVREHQGELLYEGGRRGGIFTVVLPPHTT